MTQILNLQKKPPHAMDIQTIQNALMDMLYNIKAGIQAQTPSTELATKQLTQAMIANMTKGSGAQPLMPQITPEQLAEAYSALPNATPELGEQFTGLIKDFIRGYIDIAQKQRLTNGTLDE